jgi:hypothetical protein
MTAEPPDPAADPRALLVCKKPIPVQAEFADADGICATLEGPVRFRTGDAILTGGQGERWPVRRDLFLAGYEPVPPVEPGQNGPYRKAPAPAQALRLDRALDVKVGWQDDPLHASAGDWLLRYADGSEGVVRDAIFRATYGPAPGETRWPPPGG